MQENQVKKNQQKEDLENRKKLSRINNSNFVSILNEACCIKDDLQFLLEKFSGRFEDSKELLNYSDRIFFLHLQRFQMFYDCLFDDLENYLKFFKISRFGSSEEVLRALDDIFLF